jgi:hypothetical protein
MLSDAVPSLRGSSYRRFTSRLLMPITFTEAVQMDVETLVERIGTLVAERQRLRREAAPRTALEENRREIARLQWELSHALIQRHRAAAA